MIKIFELIKKDFKLLVRAKASSLVIFIGPLVLVSLLGLAYSHSSGFSLSAGVFSEGYTEVTESLITKMNNQNFVVNRLESLEDCVSSVKRNDMQACIIFPAGMSADKVNEITFYVDYSQINLVWLILDVMSARVSERSDEISKDLTADLLERMSYIEQKMMSAKSLIASGRAESDTMKSSSDIVKENMQKIDIGVDFTGLDISGTVSSVDSVSSVLASVNIKLEKIANDTDSDIVDIEKSVEDIKNIVNDSSVDQEIDNIEISLDGIDSVISNALSSIGKDTSNASVNLAEIKNTLDMINKRLEETQNRIADAKKSRDDLLPKFDDLSSNIQKMSENVNAMGGIIDDALLKVSALQGKTPELISSPIKTRIEPISAQKTHFNSLFPTLLVLVVMITGILLASSLVIVEKKSKALFRNNLTPTSYLVFSFSTYVTSLMVIIIQLLLFVSVSAFFFETDILGSVWIVAALIILASSVFIGIGMLIGFSFKNEETANLAAITIIAILLMFSSAVIPIESLSGYMKDVALFNPFVISEMAIRQSMMFHMAAPFYSMIKLLICFAGIFVLLLLIEKSARRFALINFTQLHIKGRIVKEKKGSAGIIVKPNSDVLPKDISVLHSTTEYKNQKNVSNISDNISQTVKENVKESLFQRFKKKLKSDKKHINKIENESELKSN